MKKLLTLCVLCGFILGGFAAATETRVTSMGFGAMSGEGDRSSLPANLILKDEFSIWYYPSRILEYPNLFTAEFTQAYYDDKSFGEFGNNMYKVGANFSVDNVLNQDWVWGFYFWTTPYDHSVTDFDQIYFNYWDGYWGYTNTRLGLFAGTQFGEIPFGLNINYYGASFEENNAADNEDDNMEESFTRFEVQLGATFMQGKLDVTGSLAFTTWTDKDWAGSTFGVVDESEPDGNMDFGLRARYFADPMGPLTLIPHAAFVYQKQGIDTLGNDDGSWVEAYNYEIKRTLFDLGLGMNIDVDENILVAGDFGFQFMTEEETKTDLLDDEVTDESKDTWTSLPYFRIGIDAEITDWLQLYSGVVTMWMSDKWEDMNFADDPDDDREETQSYVYTCTFLGVGININRFQLDLHMNPQWIVKGPYLLSGSRVDDYYGEGYNNFAYGASLRYNFDF